MTRVSGDTRIESLYEGVVDYFKAVDVNDGSRAEWLLSWLPQVMIDAMDTGGEHKPGLFHNARTELGMLIYGEWDEEKNRYKTNRNREQLSRLPIDVLFGDLEAFQGYRLGVNEAVTFGRQVLYAVKEGSELIKSQFDVDAHIEQLMLKRERLSRDASKRLLVKVPLLGAIVPTERIPTYEAIVASFL